MAPHRTSWGAEPKQPAAPALGAPARAWSPAAIRKPAQGAGVSGPRRAARKHRVRSQSPVLGPPTWCSQSRTARRWGATRGPPRAPSGSRYAGEGRGSVGPCPGASTLQDGGSRPSLCQCCPSPDLEEHTCPPGGLADRPMTRKTCWEASTLCPVQPPKPTPLAPPLPPESIART